MSYDFTRLERNLIDLIDEQQLKLGYRSETIRLYFPGASLSHLLHIENDQEELLRALKEFCQEMQPRFGQIEISYNKSSICLVFPPEAADYVHAHAPKDAFLSAFLAEISSHECSLSSLAAVFHRFSDHVHIERMTDEEFDYLIYFPDGKPNDYRYCITFEEFHATYHRFIPEDYADYGFSAGNSLHM